MKRQSGFTILEAMIALLILGVATVGMVTVTMTSARYVKSSTHRIIAQGIAQGEIGKMRILGYTEMEANLPYDYQEFVLDEGDPNRDDDNLEAYLQTYAYPVDMDGDGTADVYSVWAEVYWFEGTRYFFQHSSSYVARR